MWKRIDAPLQSRHNQTSLHSKCEPVEDLALRSRGLRRATYCSYMSLTSSLSSLSRLTHDRSEETNVCLTDSTAAMIDELAHELRQPLSAIEHIAFLLEMSATDGKAVAYIEQIQDLIEQANRVLEKARAGLSCASI